MFSLIMATVGREVEVGHFIESIAAQSLRDFELIIVDQNSDDRLVKYVDRARELDINIKHVKLDKPNLSVARNLGIRLAEGEYVAFPDDDCWYEFDVLENVKKTFDCENSDCAIASWVEQDMYLGTSEFSITAESWRSFRAGSASSITIFLKLKILRQLSGFDSRLGVGQWFGSGEETDLIFRLVNDGFSCVRQPKAKIHHHFQTRKVITSFLSVRSRARGTGALYAKHDLSFYVIARGFISPLLRAAFSPKNFLYHVNVHIGRVQGYLTWKYINLRKN